MDDLVFFYPEGHEKHYEVGHPERPERVESIRTALEAKEFKMFHVEHGTIKPRNFS